MNRKLLLRRSGICNVIYGYDDCPLRCEHLYKYNYAVCRLLVYGDQDNGWKFSIGNRIRVGDQWIQTMNKS